MNSQIHRMTPLMPEEADELQNLALEVLQKSAALGNRQHSVTLNTLRELLRIINSYYSNLIE
ncbi:MAG: Fic family protein, partial [Syntrophales bacterium LBB04]|nr:Fic family protein [Syntrophales bacterium LBB04]